VCIAIVNNCFAAGSPLVGDRDQPKNMTDTRIVLGTGNGKSGTEVSVGVSSSSSVLALR